MTARINYKGYVIDYDTARLCYFIVWGERYPDENAFTFPDVDSVKKWIDSVEKEETNG